MNIRKYIVGNWKMNQTLADIESFFQNLQIDNPQCETWIAPQALHIPLLLERSKSLPLKIGAQNISTQRKGAYTGETSAQSLQDLGGTFALVGHSERRTLFGEDHETLNKKLHLLSELGLTTIFCIGEKLEEREEGMTEAILRHQLLKGLENFPLENLDQLIVAYEPIWAIGTGKVATPEMAEETHRAIRSVMEELYGQKGTQVPLLYGGSVKPDNIQGLLSQENIDGALVGGASLKGSDFSALVKRSS